MRISFLFLLASLFLPGISTGRELVHRIVLNRRPVTLTERIPTPQDSVVFMFKANADQQISAKLTPVNSSLIPQAVLIYPSGKQEGPGTVLRNAARESGTYRIRVTPREQSTGKFKLYLDIQ